MSSHEGATDPVERRVGGLGLAASRPMGPARVLAFALLLLSLGATPGCFLGTYAAGPELPSDLSGLALGMILGGAIGNLVDRIRYHEVVDFLHFKLWQGYSWPDFNLADSFIVVGVGLLVLELLVSEGENQAGAPPESA